MTPNKQFNTYKEGLDLEFLREYCMEHGERRVMERDETREDASEPSRWTTWECISSGSGRKMEVDSLIVVDEACVVVVRPTRSSAVDFSPPIFSKDCATWFLICSP